MERMRYEVAMELGIDGIEVGYLGDMSCVQCGQFGHLLYARAKQILAANGSVETRVLKNQHTITGSPENRHKTRRAPGLPQDRGGYQGATHRRSKRRDTPVPNSSL